MLHAILHGKAGRIEQSSDDNVSWSSLFKAREDLLTATVFERFAYLSAAVQQQLLSHWLALPVNIIADDLGEFQGIEYWPRYQLNHGSESRQVEPDLVIRFGRSNLLVEIKPPYGGNQTFGQWQQEIAAFLQSDDRATNPLYFLAIGRVPAGVSADWVVQLMGQFGVEGALVQISSCEWQCIADQLNHLLGQQRQQLANSDVRILEDMQQALTLYGLHTSPFQWTDFGAAEIMPLTLAHPWLVESTAHLAAPTPPCGLVNWRHLTGRPLETLTLSSLSSFKGPAHDG